MSDFNELKDFIDNNAQLFYQYKEPIFTNLQKHFKKGRFDEAKATIATQRLVDVGAKAYTNNLNNYCCNMFKWNALFPLDGRRLLAKFYVQEFLDEYAN